MSASHSEFMRAANERRLASFRKNSRLIAGVRWLGTLDRSCCAACGALDGASWDLDGNPLGDHVFQFCTPPLHTDCRCVLSPIPKSLAEFGLDIPESTRASTQGPVPASTTFEDFLKRQPIEHVERVLGRALAELFLSGRLSLRDLTLAELSAASLPDQGSRA